MLYSTLALIHEAIKFSSHIASKNQNKAIQNGNEVNNSQVNELDQNKHSRQKYLIVR